MKRFSNYSKHGLLRKENLRFHTRKSAKNSTFSLLFMMQQSCIMWVSVKRRTFMEGQIVEMEECQAYFKARPVFEKIFGGFKKKYESLGHMGGTVVLKNLSKEEKEQVCASPCIGCEDCAKNCPCGAIYMEDNHAVIDHSLCENCHMCQYVCRNNVIKELEVPEYIYRQREALLLEEEGGNRS